MLYEVITQIVAYETDLLEYGDIFDGSREIAAKVASLKAEAKKELARIEELGGAICGRCRVGDLSDLQQVVANLPPGRGFLGDQQFL